MTDILRNLLKNRTREFYIVAPILWLLPILTLTVLGFVYLWQVGWFWWFSGALLLLSLTTWLVRYLLLSPEDNSEGEVVHLDPRPDWSTRDNEAWNTSRSHIESARLVDTPWEDIPKAMLDQIKFVARSYHGDKDDADYAFSVPELLLMLETWSREYRAQVIDTVPLAQEVKISTVMGLSRRADNLQKIYKYASPFIRAFKIGINPVTGLMSEVTSQVAVSIFSDLGLHMQANMKIVLFEQATQVAIDLYSGRLKLSEDELLAIRGSQPTPELEKIKPLSVMILGQVNAGKSSLINALKQQCVAEIDPLAATAGFHRHHMLLSEDLDVYLIDTPGLDGNADTSKALLAEAVNADLLLWVSQANQPAKALDRQFLQAWNAYFDDNLHRRKPPILLVTTHNDRLSHTAAWHPPYDLTATDDSTVKAMTEALNYTHHSIGLSDDNPTVPVSLLDGVSRYNIDALHQLLVSISDQARAAQLNRERLGGDETASAVLKGLKQGAELIKFGMNLARK